MKKKLLLGVLAMVMTATTAFGMAACSCQGNNGGAGNSTESFSSLEESSSEVESESSVEESLSEVESSAEESSSEENSSEVESSSEESSSEVESSTEESSIEESSSEESSEDSTPVENDSSEDSSDDSSEVHEHTYEVVDSKAATCTENGYETYTCGGCGDSYTQTLIGYGGHDLITEIEKEATCTESGKIVTRCQREFCDYEKVTITYGSHNYYIKETQEATCTTDGYVLYACENCDDEYTLTTEASHNYEESGRVAAQVGVAGSITYTCTKCRDSYSIEIPALPEVDKSATVLLIQDNLPWAEDVNTSLLKTLYQRGTVESYNVVNTSALANVTLTDYGVIFIANDQSTSMYNRLENYTDELTAYVNAGGVLIYGACDEGWGGCGSFTGSLPGGVTTGNYYSVYNYIVDELHPVVTGVYTDGRNLYNELLKGNYCSHTYFNASTLPAETKVILQDGNGRPTLVEYPLGQGTVLASGLTWEYFYVRNHYNMVTNYSKYAFDDMLTYAIMLATIEPCEHNYEAGETVEPTCADKGYTEYICTECGRVIHSDYVDATGEHILGDWYTASEPTCATAGEQRRDCELCDYYETDDIPATGEHNYRTSLELPPADYTEQNFVGEIIFQCECGASLTREVHWTVVEEQAGNCQAAGYRNYVYEYVDPNGEMQVGEYTVVGETLPHRYNGYEIDIDQVLDWDYALQIFDANGDGEITEDEGLTWFANAPMDCQSEGMGSFRCDICGELYAISVAGDHNWEEIETVPPSSCAERGYTVYGCTECGAETMEFLPTTGLHSYNGYEIDIGAEYSWDDVIEIFGEEMEGLMFFSGTPTFCAETSDAVFECSVCGSLISITVIGPHDYSDGNCIYCGEPDPNVPIIDEETIEFLGDGSVNFGKYPQTKVTDSATTSALTSLAGALPTVNAGGWTSYGYYISGSNATDYMWYQDVEYGGSKYRGVYFSSYRPNHTDYSSSTDNTWQDDNGYAKSTLYWFEYEWINWTILEENDGEYFLLCNSIIDSQEYYHSKSSRTINGKTVYANNYAESNIRKWLNETFYETAFNEMQQNLIQTTLVDNSAKSTNPYGQETYWNNGVNDYACENTNDKIFLLSEEEVTNSNYGFASAPGTGDTVRCKQTSDYAQSQCAYTYGGSYDGNGDWWLRSPYCNSASFARVVGGDGRADYSDSVCYTIHSVVPALKLVL